MNIGFVSTWFERGGAYVSKSYIDILIKEHNLFVYARGGEVLAKEDSKWNKSYVTWGLELPGTNINYGHMKSWIKINNIDTVFFNEQHEIEVIYKLKKEMPQIKIGSYIDYYKENTISEFMLFDFLICNTQRHYSVFKSHPQCYYVPWGTDINLFTPNEKKNTSNELTFFHSVGMSKRKGTNLLIEAFITGELFKESKLIIHTQIDIESNFNYSLDELDKYNIEVIEKTVGAPGLYYLGDVYVYPTTLDGLGLTLYEALSSGLPIITTNNAPMNEVVNKEVGYLVEVESYSKRNDDYYWPISNCNITSLINGMKYFTSKKLDIEKLKQKARLEAKEKWNWKDREEEINKIFERTKVIVKEPNEDLISKKTIIEKIIISASSTEIAKLYPALKAVNKIIKKRGK